MGECGCGATTIDYLLPGPDGSVYGIEVYSGCHYCGTGAGVVVYRHVPGDDNILAPFIEGVPDLELTPYGTGEDAECLIPIISREALVVSMKESMADLLEGQDFGTGDLFRTIEDAVHHTRSEARV